MSGEALVLDVGTSGVKAALLGRDGSLQAQAARPLRTHRAEGGVVEQDADDWWAATVGAVRALAGDGPLADGGSARELQQTGAGAPLASVEALVLTGQMQDLTLADRRGRPLRATLLYPDTRAVAEAVEVEERIGVAELRRLTGNDQDAGGLLAKLRWLRRHEPELLARAEHLFLGAVDAVGFRLIGRAVCDTTTASTTGLLELSTRRALPGDVWRALDLADVPGRLPRFAAGGAEAGALTADAARELGLAEGLSVHLGPGDAGAATVGAGSGEPGPASGYVGTSGWVAFSADAPGDPDAGVFTLAHPAPGRTVQVAPLLTAGGNLAWARAALGAGAAYEDLIDEALQRPPGRLLYLPYLQGERAPFRDPDARGAFLGLSLATTHLDMVRAVLEGVAFGYRHALRALAPDAPALVLSGGGTRSEAWCRLFATVVGVPVRVLQEPDAVALRGALRCAQVASGRADDYRLKLHAHDLAPDEALRERYDALFECYLEAYPALRDTFRTLAQD